MHQLKQVIHNHYSNAAIISLHLKGFVRLCRYSLGAPVLPIILSIVSWTGKSHGSVSHNATFATHIHLSVSFWASPSVQRTFMDRLCIRLFC